MLQSNAKLDTFGDDDARQPVEVLCEEFLDRWRRGESPTIDEYAAKYGALKDEIEVVFPAMLAMENVKTDRLARSSAGRPVQLQVERLEQLGDYRIIRELGRGGMAIVFEAEQQSLHRRVAVKVFPQQSFNDSKQLRRFQREAKTIGGLHHNNIVPVFGTGEQDGLHYFVMQLLDGVSLDCVITELKNSCDEVPAKNDAVQRIVDAHLPHLNDNLKATSADSIVNQSTVGEISPEFTRCPTEPTGQHLEAARLFGTGNPLRRGRAFYRRVADLGRQVADGLQYAHGKGVLHRDIKPSNLVIDGSCRVWITDFGLATGLSHDRLSQSGDIVGTLRYMAPERLNGSADERSDVYSLGLTMYELCTLQPAFEGNSRGKLTRQVLGGSPPAPSSICPDIPRDLETIVLKAISLEPDSRYQSALELAADLRNFCDDQPILARRMGRVEKLSRWSTRNPMLATLSTALLVCVVVSLATITINWRTAVRQQRLAEAEGERAETILVLALESMDRFLQKYEADWMSHPIAPDTEDEQPDPSLRFVVSEASSKVLVEALAFYDQFALQNATNPRLKQDTAKAYQRAGDIHERLGHYAEAETAYRQSVKILDYVVNTSDLTVEQAVAIASAHNQLAEVLHRTYQRNDALSELKRSKAVLTAQLSKHEVSPECRYALGLTNLAMGEVLFWLYDRQESSQRIQSAIVQFEQLMDEDPTNAMYRLSLARAYGSRYHYSSFGKDRRYAEQILRAGEEILEKLVQDFPDVPDYRCELSEMLTNTASSSHCDKRVRREHAERAVDLARQLVTDFETIPRYKAALAEALSELAELTEPSSLEAAATLHRDAVSRYNELCHSYPEVVHYLSYSARAFKNQGQCFEKQGDLQSAKFAFSNAIENQREYLRRREDSNFGKKWMSDYLKQLASVEDNTGNANLASNLRAEAEEFYKPRSQRR